MGEGFTDKFLEKIFGKKNNLPNHHKPHAPDHHEVPGHSVDADGGELDGILDGFSAAFHRT